MFVEEAQSKRFIPLSKSGVADNVSEHYGGEPSGLVRQKVTSVRSFNRKLNQFPLFVFGVHLNNCHLKSTIRTQVTTV